MPIKSAPYYYAECDNCGVRAEYEGDIGAWEQAHAAADEAIADDWTEKDGKFHCPSCPPLDVDEEAEAVA